MKQPGRRKRGRPYVGWEDCIKRTCVDAHSMCVRGRGCMRVSERCVSMCVPNEARLLRGVWRL